MTLDERARRASRAIHASVDALTPLDLSSQPQRARRHTLLYVPMAAVFVLLIASIVLIRTRDVIRPASPTLGKRVATIPLGYIPSAVVAGPSSTVWVASTDAGMVLKVDVMTNRVVGSVHVGVMAGPLVLSSGSVWVASDPKGVVTQVDAATMRVVKRLNLGSPITGMAVQDNFVWAATLQGFLVAIDSTSGDEIHDFLVSSDIQGLVAAAGSLWTIEPRVGFQPEDVVLYVLRVDPGSGKVLHTFLLGQGTDSDYITTFAGAVWAASLHPGNITRIGPSANTLQTFDIPSLYVASLVSPDVVGSSVSGRTLWLIAGDSSHWYLVQMNARTGNVVNNVLLADEGIGPAVSPGALWVGLSTSKTLLRYQLNDR